MKKFLLLFSNVLCAQIYDIQAFQTSLQINKNNMNEQESLQEVVLIIESSYDAIAIDLVDQLPVQTDAEQEKTVTITHNNKPIMILPAEICNPKYIKKFEYQNGKLTLEIKKCDKKVTCALQVHRDLQVEIITGRSIVNQNGNLSDLLINSGTLDFKNQANTNMRTLKINSGNLQARFKSCNFQTKISAAKSNINIEDKIVDLKKDARMKINTASGVVTLGLSETEMNTKMLATKIVSVKGTTVIKHHELPIKINGWVSVYRANTNK